LIWAVAAVWMGLAVPLAGAQQIVLVDDGHGRKVYVNVEPPPPRPAAVRRASVRGARPSPEIDKIVQQAAERHQVDPRLVRAVIQVESDYDSQAVSSKGAIGLMQLIPSTAQRFGVQNPFNAKQNIEGGVNYLKYLLNLFDGNVTLSLAAYNSGEHTVLRRGGVPHIPETVNYVRKVRSLYDSGAMSGSLAAKSTQPPPVTIYKYVDASGVVHYTDGGDL
jgi:soluble lytic murein transglycosylase-like protein